MKQPYAMEIKKRLGIIQASTVNKGNKTSILNYESLGGSLIDSDFDEHYSKFGSYSPKKVSSFQMVILGYLFLGRNHVVPEQVRFGCSSSFRSGIS
jgi:hypothetical protein